MTWRAGLLAAAWIGMAGMAGAQDLPAPLAQAISASNIEDSRDNWRFRVTVTTDEGEMRGQFDGTALEGQQWTLLHPAEAELEGTLLEIWEDIQTDEDDAEDDGGLFFQGDDFEYVPGSIASLGGPDSGLRYQFAPQMDEDEAAFAEFVSGEVLLGGEEPHVQQIRIFATESFKPNVAVRVNAFEMVQEFALIDGLPAPVMSRMSQTIAGSAAFQSFEQNVDIRFEDIEFISR